MKKKIAVLFLVFSMVFISCDQEFNTIGADLVGDEHFDFSTYEPALKAYSVKTNEVQTNNLPLNPIGIYNNPYFGETKSSFVTQLALATSQPKFGTNVRIEDVTLYVPYFCTAGATNSDGDTSYTLDSIYGANKESKMKLSVYENGYFLNNFDPNTGFQTSQRYYNDGSSISGPIDFDNLKRGAASDNSSVQGGDRLNNSTDVAENDQFFFSKKQIVVYKKKLNSSGDLVFVDDNGVELVDQTDNTKWVVRERLAPGIYLTLNREFFKKKILDASASNLFNNNNFRQYFKGLYFKIEGIAGQEGAMAMINFNNAKLKVNYSSVTDGAPASSPATSKAFIMNLGSNATGNTVSLQDFAYTDTLTGGNYSTGLSSPGNVPTNPSFGQNDKLYVKGGKGSVVYMDVFGEDVEKLVDGVFVPGANEIPDELERLRLKGWLINDAYIEFYVDKSAMAGANQKEPERLYLFDATNQRPLVDYTLDASTSTNSKRSKYIFNGIINRDASDKKGVKYKIRITQHINNLLNSKNANLNKNIKLGLCVTENIALVSSFYYKTPVVFPLEPEIKYFPVASIMSQQGTVLHGTASADVAKRLKLTIHYTKPN